MEPCLTKILQQIYLIIKINLNYNQKNGTFRVVNPTEWLECVHVIDRG